MNADEVNTSKIVQRNGISVRIRPTLKNDITRYVVDYRNQGQRKLIWRSTMAEAHDAANETIDKITEGQSEVLNLKAADAHAYNCARGYLQGTGKEIDRAYEEIAEIYRLLSGRATPVEVARDWLKRNAEELPKIDLTKAVELLKNRPNKTKKSKDRKKQLTAVLDAFALAFNQESGQLISLTSGQWVLGCATGKEPFIDQAQSSLGQRTSRANEPHDQRSNRACLSLPVPGSTSRTSDCFSQRIQLRQTTQNLGWPYFVPVHLFMLAKRTSTL